MITCPSCQTLNPEGEASCLVCRASLTGARDAADLTGSTRCPNGHPIDPSWSSCPYCTRTRSDDGPGSAQATLVEAGASGGSAVRRGTTRLETGEAPSRPRAAADGGRATRLEGEGGSADGSPAARSHTRLEGDGPGVPAGAHDASSGSGPPPAAPRSAGPRPTRHEALGEPSRQTVLHEQAVVQEAAPKAAPAPAMPPSSAPSAGSPAVARAPGARSPGSERRLVAVLAAPDLVAGGRVFAVRAGKNRIGADPRSEICLREDPEVSSDHALVLHRGGTFYLTDRMSTNGTWINDREVDPTSNSVVLRDRDRVRCGRTELIFVTLEAQSAEAPAPSAESDVSEPGPIREGG